MKTYTDIEQSKVLAEILPIESADGFWEYHDKWYSEGDEWEGYEDYPRAEPYLEYTRKENEWKEDKSDVPCWSLTSLFDILPVGTEQHKQSDDSTFYYVEVYNDGKYLSTKRYTNPIDACVGMILKLHELNLLQS